MLCSVPYTYTMHLTYHQVHWCHTLYLIPLPYTYHILCSLKSPWWTSPSSLKSHSVPHTSTIHLSHFVFTTNTMVNITKFTVVALCTVYLYHASITFCVHRNHHAEHHHHFHWCYALYLIPLPCTYHSSQYSHYQYHYSSYTGDQCYFLTHTFHSQQ